VLRECLSIQLNCLNYIRILKLYPLLNNTRVFINTTYKQIPLLNQNYSQQIITKSLICCLILSVIATTCLAQYDSSYIRKYDQKFLVKGFLYKNILNLSASENDKSAGTDYVPNNPVGLGVGFSYQDFIFDLTYGQNIGIKANNDYLKTNSFDFQIHRYSRKYSADIFIQQYQGLYVDDENLSIEKSNCPDLYIFQVGLTGQYLLNWKKFSYKAAFNQSEKQLNSAGSFLLGGGIYYFRIDSDSSFVFKNEINCIRSFQWGLNAGYAYNWVIGKHWLTSSSLSIGLNVGNERVKSFFNKDICINPTVILRLSMFYNSDSWSLGFLFTGNFISLMYPDESEIDLTSGRFEMMYAYRFDFRSKAKAKNITQ
jgi:hypothetical protein